MGFIIDRWRGKMRNKIAKGEVTRLVPRDDSNVLSDEEIEKVMGVGPSTQGIPEGLVTNAVGEGISYYAGNDPPPEYLCFVDSLLDKLISAEEMEELEVERNGKWEALQVGNDYYTGFEWDVTKAGSYSIINKGIRYFTVHQPTEIGGGMVWFRKVVVRDRKGGENVRAIWEKFVRE